MTPDQTEFEEKLVRALKEMPAEWTPACFPEETLWEFAERGGEHPDAMNLIRHIPSCGYCSQGYLAMKEALRLRKQLADSEQTEPEPTPNGWERLRVFLKAPKVRSRLSLSGMALAGAAVMLLLLLPGLSQRTQRLQKAEESARRHQQDSTRKSQQIQAVQAELEQQKKETAKMKALASARAGNHPPQPPTQTPDLPYERLRAVNRPRASAGSAEQNTITLLDPAGTSALHLRPVFGWKLEHAIPEVSEAIGRYEIKIVNTTTGKVIPVPDIEVAAGTQEVSWRIPSGKLKPATEYIWSVYAHPPKKNKRAEDEIAKSAPDQEIRFYTPTEAEMGENGRLLAQRGNLYEAELALEEDPKNPRSVKLLNEIRDLRKSLQKPSP
jgi:hypothetical protein